MIYHVPPRIGKLTPAVQAIFLCGGHTKEQGSTISRLTRLLSQLSQEQRIEHATCIGREPSSAPQGPRLLITTITTPPHNKQPPRLLPHLHRKWYLISQQRRDRQTAIFSSSNKAPKRRSCCRKNKPAKPTRLKPLIPFTDNTDFNIPCPKIKLDKRGELLHDEKKIFPPHHASSPRQHTDSTLIRALSTTPKNS